MVRSWSTVLWNGPSMNWMRPASVEARSPWSFTRSPAITHRSSPIAGRCARWIAHALTGGASSALSHMALLRVERVRRRRDLHQGSVIANDPESTPHSGYSGEESRSAWSNTDLDRNTGVHRNMDLDRNKLEEDHNNGRDKLDRQGVVQRRSLSPPLSRLRRLPRRLEGEAG